MTGTSCAFAVRGDVKASSARKHPMRIRNKAFRLRNNSLKSETTRLRSCETTIRKKNPWLNSIATIEQTLRHNKSSCYMSGLYGKIGPGRTSGPN